jgi:hypothetical protein
MSDFILDTTVIPLYPNQCKSNHRQFLFPIHESTNILQIRTSKSIESCFACQYLCFVIRTVSFTRFQLTWRFLWIRIKRIHSYNVKMMQLYHWSGHWLWMSIQGISPVSDKRRSIIRLLYLPAWCLARSRSNSKCVFCTHITWSYIRPREIEEKRRLWMVQYDKKEIERERGKIQQ